MKILYIDVDSLRPDHLGCYGYHRNTSPVIDSLAREGLRLTNLYASDVPCLPSRTAMWSGRCGYHTGVINHGGTAAQPFIEGSSRIFRDEFGLRGWMRCLRDLGHYTATISSFAERHSAWHWYAGYNEMHNIGKGGLETADEVTPLALDWLETNATRENWFLHVNFWDPHTPYNTPLEYGNPFADEPIPSWYSEELRAEWWKGYGPHSAQEPHHMDANPNFVARAPRMPLQIDSMDSLRRWIDGYDVGIRYMDDHLGKIFESLKHLGIWEEVVVIVSADHGENQGELNVWGDHQTADQITCRLPGIVRWPGMVAPGSSDDGLHYHFDLAATVLELLGGMVPATWDGQSFAPAVLHGEQQPAREYLVLSQGAWACQRSVRFENYLCIFTYHAGYKQIEPVSVYDLDADPHQLTNLVSSRPELVQRASAMLSSWQREMDRTATTDVDPMRTVMLEGGPYHCKTELPKYLERLKATGRAGHADTLAKLHSKGC